MKIYKINNIYANVDANFELTPMQLGGITSTHTHNLSDVTNFNAVKDTKALNTHTHNNVHSINSTLSGDVNITLPDTLTASISSNNIIINYSPASIGKISKIIDNSSYSDISVLSSLTNNQHKTAYTFIENF